MIEFYLFKNDSQSSKSRFYLPVTVSRGIVREEHPVSEFT